MAHKQHHSNITPTVNKGRNPKFLFLCENEKWLKEVTIISKGNDKNNEHFLDFSENLVSQKDLQLVDMEEKQNKEKVVYY